MIAAVKLPNINPIIRIDMVFLMFFATSITIANTKNAPKLAAKAILKFEIDKAAEAPTKAEVPNSNNATPKLAPELTPNTNGPASGFLNRVCINKPQMERPEPTKMAVIDLGSRKFKIIFCQDSFKVSFPNTILIISITGMSTEPKLILIKKATSSTPKKSRNFSEYVVLFFNYFSGSK